MPKREKKAAKDQETPAKVEAPVVAEKPVEQPRSGASKVALEKYEQAVRSRHKSLPTDVLSAIQGSKTKGTAQRVLKEHLQRESLDWRTKKDKKA